MPYDADRTIIPPYGVLRYNTTDKYSDYLSNDLSKKDIVDIKNWCDMICDNIDLTDSSAQHTGDTDDYCC